MTSEAAVRALTAINLAEGIGWVTYSRLLEKFGSPEAITEARASALEKTEGVGPKKALALRSAIQSGNADEEIERARTAGINIVPYLSEQYPKALKHIPDPPLVLYVKGGLCREDAIALAFVGSRRASMYGLRAARRLAGQAAAAGFTIVSGLARGIDRAAHEAAIEVGGRTIGVVGSGLLNIYPKEAAAIVEPICDCGAVMSEFPLDFGPLKGNFPRRNRIISGLSLGVVVVEAARNSGSLITARHAAEQGREVFAVPGQIGSASSVGANRLIQDGAKLVLDLSDITNELGVLEAPADVGGIEGVSDLRAVSLNDVERRVFEAVDNDGASVEDIIARSGLAASTVSSTLLILEMKRLVKQLSGKRFVRF
ncbi:MAG: DNA-processing protein DprA [Planctomycetota bacterium]|jgi:DNA processing protein